MTPRRWVMSAASITAAAVILTACGGGSDDDGEEATTTTDDSSQQTTTSVEPGPEASLEEVRLDTTEVAEVQRPTMLASRPSSPDLYVTEQVGRIRLIKVTEPTGGSSPLRYQLQTTPVLDLTNETLSTGNEQGLLGLAFTSDGRKLYVNYTAKPDGRTVVAEYELGDRTTVDLDTRRVLLEIDQPHPNHNGGSLVLGPDGYLYIGMGDGGSGGDPKGRAQNRNDLLGKILRIDPEGSGAGSEGEYAIPAGNPFADGEDGAPEVWLFGVRNPWRFSFDSLTGDLWIGDVGQNKWEEIDLLPAVGGFDAGRGANLGWDRMEGSHSFEGDNPPGGVLPVFEYSRDEGCSVTGGFVYRGEAIEPLQGAYLFADYCAEGLRALQMDGTTVIDERTFDLGFESVFSFGQDNDGELFVLLGSGSVRKLVLPGDD